MEREIERSRLSSLTLEFLTDDDSSSKDSVTSMKTSREKELPSLMLKQTVTFKQRLNDSSNGNFDIVNALWGRDYADYKEVEATLYEQANTNPMYFRVTPALIYPKYEDYIVNATGVDTDFKYDYIAKKASYK